MVCLHGQPMFLFGFGFYVVEAISSNSGWKEGTEGERQRRREEERKEGNLKLTSEVLLGKVVRQNS